MMSGLHVPVGLAISSLSLLGPMQVAGRLASLVSRRLSAVHMGKLAMIGLVLGLLCLHSLTLFPWLAFAFTIVYGAANGVMTLVRGFAPAELLGELNYASTLGMLAAPALVARALGPLLATAVIEREGIGLSIWILVIAAILGTFTFWYASKLSLKTKYFIPRISPKK